MNPARLPALWIVFFYIFKRARDFCYKQPAWWNVAFRIIWYYRLWQLTDFYLRSLRVHCCFSMSFTLAPDTIIFRNCLGWERPAFPAPIYPQSKTVKPHICCLNMSGQYLFHYVVLVEVKYRRANWILCCKERLRPQEDRLVAFIHTYHRWD